MSLNSQQINKEKFTEKIVKYVKDVSGKEKKNSKTLNQNELIEQIIDSTLDLVKIKKKLKKWNHHLLLLETLASKNNQPISIRLKGELLKTTKSTLMKCKWFLPVFTTWKSDDINLRAHDPKIFEYILEFLRYDHWNIEYLDVKDYEEFLTELEFFDLQISKSELNLNKNMNEQLVLNQTELLLKVRKQDENNFIKDMIAKFPSLSDYGWSLPNLKNYEKSFRGLTFEQITKMHVLLYI